MKKSNFGSLIAGLSLAAATLTACVGNNSQSSSTPSNSSNPSTSILSADQLYSQLHPLYKQKYQATISKYQRKQSGVNAHTSFRIAGVSSDMTSVVENIIGDGLTAVGLGGFNTIIDQGMDFINAIFGDNTTPDYQPDFNQIFTQLNGLQTQIAQFEATTSTQIAQLNNTIINEFNTQTASTTYNTLTAMQSEQLLLWATFQNDVGGIVESNITSSSYVNGSNLYSFNKLLQFFHGSVIAGYTTMPFIANTANNLVANPQTVPLTDANGNTYIESGSAFQLYAVAARLKLGLNLTNPTSNIIPLIDQYNTQLTYEYIKSLTMLQELYAMEQLALNLAFNPYTMNFGDATNSFATTQFSEPNIPGPQNGATSAELQSQYYIQESNLNSLYLNRRLLLQQQYAQNLITDTTPTLQPSQIFESAHTFGPLAALDSHQANSWVNSCSIYVWSGVNGSTLTSSTALNLASYNGSYDGQTLNAECWAGNGYNSTTPQNNFSYTLPIAALCSSGSTVSYFSSNQASSSATTGAWPGLFAGTNYTISQNNGTQSQAQLQCDNFSGMSIPSSYETAYNPDFGQVGSVGYFSDYANNIQFDVPVSFAYANSVVAPRTYDQGSYYTFVHYQSADGYSGIYQVGEQLYELFDDNMQLACLAGDPFCSQLGGGSPSYNANRNGLTGQGSSAICLAHHRLNLNVSSSVSDYGGGNYWYVQDSGNGSC